MTGNKILEVKKLKDKILEAKKWQEKILNSQKQILEFKKIEEKNSGS